MFKEKYVVDKVNLVKFKGTMTMMACTKTNTAKQEKIKQDEMTIKQEFLF